MPVTRSNSSGFDKVDKKCRNLKDLNKTFTQKNVFSLKNNPMCGVTSFQWTRILLPRIGYAEIQYIPRIIFITALSVVNTVLAVIETLLYGQKIQNTKVSDDPIFIIGHPRTGTTLLHNLLAIDNENFYFCNTFCAGFPSSFLFFEKIGKILFAGVIEKTRPMDNMPLHFDLPQV